MFSSFAYHEWISTSFGVPLAPEKTEGLAMIIKFLGIVIDPVRMECRLLEEELIDLRQVVGRARLARKLRLHKLQSLFGNLQFPCRIISMGRVFCRHLATTSAGVWAPSHFIQLSEDVWNYLSIWSVFLDQFNCRSVLLEGPMLNTTLELYTDASGSDGFGVYFHLLLC